METERVTVMNSSGLSRPQRLFFMDNLRYLSVWCVVIFHTSVGYSGLPEFYVETQTDKALLAIRHAIAVFTLPMLFFLAGYFARPSLERRGALPFAKEKAIRLGSPPDWNFLSGSPYAVPGVLRTILPRSAH